ncbi:unnamed protein product [Penicillium salamii]|uniref:DNA polymerase eta n=1 Tax=Penicillium salamii TaxID=1612424 RepID=A0A9W4I511_9EURO|nr:unnamed protein product [Penicillium salamii]
MKSPLVSTDATSNSWPNVPLGVQQWNAIIALNYPARSHGLARAISVEEAREKCPSIVLQHVPTWREGCATWAYRPTTTIMPGTDKAALDPYRLESRKGLELVKRTLPDSPPPIIEKASVDEMFLDLSAQVHSILLQRYPALLNVKSLSIEESLPLPNTSVSDWRAKSVFGATTGDDHIDWDDLSLSIGSEIVDNLRREIFENLRYTCSAGIAHNKILAKLASSHKKPNHQTIVLRRGTCEFLSSHKFTKIPGLGGVLGTQIVEKFNTDMVSQLLSISLPQLKEVMGPEIGHRIFNVIRGEENSEVNPRTCVQSMLSAKTFVPKISSIDQAARWLRIFVADLLGRLKKLAVENHRVCPTIVTLNHFIEGRFGPTRSKQTMIPRSTSMNGEMLFKIAYDLLSQIVAEEDSWPCRSLSLRIAGFQDIPKPECLITSYFGAQNRSASLVSSPHVGPSGLSKYSLDRGLSKGQESTQSPPAQVEPSPEHDALNHFLTNNEPDGGPESDVNFYPCPHCKSSISMAGVLEHLDWHVALELSDTDMSHQ